MPNQEELNEVLSTSISKRKDFFYTLKYVKRCRNDKELKEMCSYLDKNSIKNVGIWMKILSLIAKDILISLELRKIRNDIFNLMFNTFNPSFNENEVKMIIENCGNYWLELNHVKIKIFKDYCLEFLKNPILCENMSKLSDNSNSILQAKDEYQEKRITLINIFDALIRLALDNYSQQQMWKINQETNQMNRLHITSIEGDMRIAKYNDAFNDNSLLQE